MQSSVQTKSGTEHIAADVRQKALVCVHYAHVRNAEKKEVVVR